MLIAHEGGKLLHTFSVVVQGVEQQRWNSWVQEHVEFRPAAKL